MRTALIPLLAICASLSAQQPAASTPVGAAWGYYGRQGPNNWSRLDPAYAECSKGKLESPIDIRGAKLDKALKPIEFHYLSGPVTLLNTGNTIQGWVVPGSYIVADGTRYDLQQFHFHFPAEHLVNGKLSDMEIQLVHKSAAGQFAVIAIEMNEGQVNGSLAALWPSLPRAAHATVKLDGPFDPSGLLPADQGYWHYIGSLTAPPCTENVPWFVMETPTQLSGDQIAAFAALYPDDARPVQPTHGRRIEASE